MWRWVAFVVAVLWCAQALAVPFGYRYVGSRVVSEGRHVYWYWNVDAVEIGPYGNSFVARMYARNVELGEERSYAAIIRCDTRTYRRFDSKEPFEAIDEGDPVFAVWRAGCADGRAVQRDARFERLNGSSAKAGTESGGESVARAGSEPAATKPAPAAAGTAVRVPTDKERAGVAASGTPATAAAMATPPSPAGVRVPDDAKAASAPGSPGDPRRVDQCIRLVEGKPSQFGDATIANTCGFDVEVVLCYKGGKGGTYDCPAPVRGMRSDSLPTGTTRQLPEYRRGNNKGIVLVACRGTIGTVFPQLDLRAGKNGCF